jgi:RimJ/RimL family protein N-acetyltransferase
VSRGPVVRPASDVPMPRAAHDPERLVSGEAVVRLPSGKAPSRRDLTSALVVLEPLDPTRHAGQLFAASHDTDDARRVWTFLPDGPFADLAAFTAWAGSMAAASDRVVYAIRDASTGHAAGMASYLDIRPSHGAIEMGYIWFAPWLQRTRQATEALFLMLRHAFDDLGYRRMQWRCNAQNDTSRAAALRLGFTFEGIFYQHMVVKGRNRDTAWYAILDGEWPRIRANFEAWLAPGNFDAAGRQKESLRTFNTADRRPA